MSRPKSPFVIEKRTDSKSFVLTINTTSGLPPRICKKWNRKSFQHFPGELVNYSCPKSKSTAVAGAMALIEFLKNDGKVNLDKITVGEWFKKFTSIEESPKGARKIAENNPYAEPSVERLKLLYDVHMKDDPIMKYKMSEVEEHDALAFINRMGQRRLKGGQYRNKKDQPLMAGTETFCKLIKFARMVFKEYGRNHPGWVNAFQYLEPPRSVEYKERDYLEEWEVLKLFQPGVLLDPMERAVCAAMFWAGLRRGEVFALKPEDLDWRTPKITVKRAWKNFSYKRRKLGVTKGKRAREVLFDEYLQESIKKLWEENGKHEFVFSFKDGTTPGPSWIEGRFHKWIKRAGIDLNGRKLVPHSSRHSLAAVLEGHGVPLRQIQEQLGHISLKTTRRYLHITDRMLADMKDKTSEARIITFPSTG